MNKIIMAMCCGAALTFSALADEPALTVSNVDAEGVAALEKLLGNGAPELLPGFVPALTKAAEQQRAWLVWFEKGDEKFYIDFDDFRVYLTAREKKPNSSAVFSAVDKNALVMLGHNVCLHFAEQPGKGRKAYHWTMDSGVYVNGAWEFELRLNGDERFSGLGDGLAFRLFRIY